MSAQATNGAGAAALKGIRVLECASMVSGPFCGKLLADFGADVIKVEPPDVGDPARRRGPFPNGIPHTEKSGLYLYLNGNKRGVTLNLQTASGQDMFRRLAGQSDIVIEDFAPGYLDGLGIGHERLSKERQSLLLVSVTSFGQTGPHAHFKAYHLNTYHAGGDGFCTPSCLSFRLYPDREPIKAGGHVGDYFCGLTAALATLGALAGCAMTGAGQHIDISKQEVLLAHTRRQIAAYANQGNLETRLTRELSYGNVYPTKDGHIIIHPNQEHEWGRLVEMMGHPAWTQEEKFRNPALRVKHGEEANEHIGEWTSHFTQEEVQRKALAHQLASAPMYRPSEVMDKAQMKARHYFAPVEHPQAGSFRVPLAYQHMTATPAAIRRPAPTLGQHNEEVYCDLLKLPRQELAKLFQARII